MQTVLITRDCLAAESEIAEALTALAETGAQAFVVGADSGDAMPIPAGLQVVAASREGDGSIADALAGELRRRADTDMHDTLFVLTRDPAAASRSESAGCRTVLVLEGRSLSSLRDEARERSLRLGKHLPAAPDLATALGYVTDEAKQTAILGPVPFGAPRGAERQSAPLPTSGDLARIFGLVVVAGTAIALAIAYFLQEIYQTFRFPPIVYWLTLQFLPDWGRGILFLLFGVAIGLLASRMLSGVSTRRSRRT
jgi:hypothetical protein